MLAHSTAPHSSADGRQMTDSGVGVPARACRPMPIQEIEIWTPLSLIRALLILLVTPTRDLKVNNDV